MHMNRREFNKTTLSFALGFGVLNTLSCSQGTRKKPAAKRPNVLICIADDASYPHMSKYGCQWVRTPAFDRVAKDGILFSNAYTPNAKCAPSRACILTGRNSWQLEAAANHVAFFPQKFKTYPEVLSENGYHVGFTGKGWAPGVAGSDKDGKPRQLCGQPYQDKKTTPPAQRISTTDYAANFEQFLAEQPEDKPFCFWYGGYEPHRGYEYGAGINKGRKKLSDVDRVFDFWPDNETVRTDMLDYAFEIEYFDSHLGKMLKLLEDSGQLDNTLVIVTSDNGMPFPRIKGQEYEFSNHMPFAAMWKGGIKKPDRTVTDFISFIDLAPTFLELAGVRERRSGMQPIQGKSFTDIFYSGTSGVVDRSRDHVLIGKERHDVGRPHDVGYPIRGIVKGGYLLIVNFKPDRWPAGNPETGYLNCDGSPTKTVCLETRDNPKTEKYWQWSFGKRVSEELYHIDSDPDCMNNLAQDPKYYKRLRTLKNELISKLIQQGDPRMFGMGDIFDEYEYADPRHKNYYERYMSGEDIKADWVNASDYQQPDTSVSE